MQTNSKIGQFANRTIADSLRTAVLKQYLKMHRWVHPKMIAKFCEPLFGGLHPSNVFHYGSEFFINNISKDDIIIDIACGTGKMLFELSPYINKGYGLEIDAKNLSLCRENHLADNIEFIQADILKFDYAEFKQKTGYNKAVMSHILEHVEDVPALLKAIDTDTILICVPSQENWTSQLLIHLELPYFTCNTHFREYTQDMLRQELDAASYKVDFMSHNSAGAIICRAIKDGI